MGTPRFAVPSLHALLEHGHEIACVFTQPDRPAGRGQALRASAVKELALSRQIAIEQPEKLRDPAVLERVRALGVDAIVVAAYGKILPKALLDLPPRGAINVHGSLLPKYRGAAPIQRAILAGDSQTGITIMQMNEKMDAGDILLQAEMPIRADDTAQSLGERLAVLGAELLADALERVARGKLVPRRQDESQVSFAPLVKKEEGAIDWRHPAEDIERMVRAFTPWPSAYTTLHEKLLKIHRASVITQAAAAPPGTVVRAARTEIDVAAGAGLLRLHELQLEGKRAVTAQEFLAGKHVAEGDHLGPNGR
jgi:methionyl-tRNA formyltransferase